MNLWNDAGVADWTRFQGWFNPSCPSLCILYAERIPYTKLRAPSDLPRHKLLSATRQVFTAAHRRILSFRKDACPIQQPCSAGAVRKPYVPGNIFAAAGSARAGRWFLSAVNSVVWRLVLSPDHCLFGETRIRPRSAST